LIDFPEQMRFVNLQRLLHGLQSVKITTSVSLRDEQVFTACVWTSGSIFLLDVLANFAGFN